MSSDFNNLLAQANQLKKDMQSMDTELQEKKFEAELDGIYCSMTGHGKIHELSLKTTAERQSSQHILATVTRLIDQLQKKIEADKQALFVKMSQAMHSNNT